MLQVTRACLGTPVEFTLAIQKNYSGGVPKHAAESRQHKN